MTPVSVDAYSNRIELCMSQQELFAEFRSEIEAEGYQNIVFGIIDGAESFEVPYCVLPENVPAVYLRERQWEHDPILAAARTSNQPFSWIDELTRRSHSQAARAIMDGGREYGVTGGMSVPFHRPDGRLDIFSLSMRDDRLLNAARIKIVAAKCYVTLQRFLVLDAPAEARNRSPIARLVAGEGTSSNTADDEADAASIAAHGAHHPQHGDTVGTIGDAECKALVLVDIARRRYRAGFLDLNERVPDIIGAQALQSYIDRGLIEEEPDDLRFRYFLKPSPVGRNHLKICPCVGNWRDDVWKSYVDAGEVPAA